eukprot:6271418-Prymnesium_polylepis.1
MNTKFPNLGGSNASGNDSKYFQTTKKGTRPALRAAPPDSSLAASRTHRAARRRRRECTPHRLALARAQGSQGAEPRARPPGRGASAHAHARPPPPPCAPRQARSTSSRRS